LHICTFANYLINSLYLPFGENMTDQRITATYSSRYTFTGKEQDALTGLHYFGARYYDARISLWYGVDPLTDEFPDWSPYNYTLNNPIRLIDPDGRGPTDFIYLFMRNAPFGFPISGHSAVLIGNDKTGYKFYNMTGDNLPNGNAKVVKQDFNSVAEFNESMNNGNGKSYELGFRIETSEQQDQAMIQEAEKGGNAPYDLTNGNNCADYVRCIGDAGNVKNGNEQSAMGITWPKKEFKELMKSNPNGKVELFGDQSFNLLKGMDLKLDLDKVKMEYVPSSKYKYTVTDETLK